jgi:hypothetical protein
MRVESKAESNAEKPTTNQPRTLPFAHQLRQGGGNINRKKPKQSQIVTIR